MTTRVMIGPYARQILLGKIKFWFAFRESDGSLKRYEASIGWHQTKLTLRLRPYTPDAAPRYGANFHDYRLPDDLTPYNQAPYPGAHKSTLADVARSLITDENDIADLTRLRFGLPISPAEYGKRGDDQCTLNLPL